MNNPVIFTVTTAGKNAALDAARRGLSVSLTRLTLGTGKWSATKSATQLRSPSLNFTLVSGDVEAASSTLRFSVTMSSNTVFDAYEIGLFTSTGVLFAVASHTTNPLVRLHPDVSIVVGSFGLHLGDLDASSITVVSDPSSPIAVQMYQQHLAAADPHPQYLTDQAFNTAHEEILRRLRALESKEIIPVGGLFITSQHYATGEDVARALGYGRWARFSKGTTLVGHDPDATTGNTKPWWSQLGNIVGEFEHQLTVNEMPSHNHSAAPYNLFSGIASDGGIIADGAGDSITVPGTDWNNSHSEIQVAKIGPRAKEAMREKPAGGNQPHNNVQPSVVVAVWVRLPNSGSISIPQLYEGTDASRYGRGGWVSTPEMQRLNDALAKVDELEQRLAQMGRDAQNAVGSWSARVSSSTVARTYDTMQGDNVIRKNEWTNPIIVQTSGLNRDVMVSVSNSGGGGIVNGGAGVGTGTFTVTFGDNTDINKITVSPQPEIIHRSGKSIIWVATANYAGENRSWTLQEVK